MYRERPLIVFCIYCLSNISERQFKFLVTWPTKAYFHSDFLPDVFLDEQIYFPAIFTKWKFSWRRTNHLAKLSIELNRVCIWNHGDLKLHLDDISTTNNLWWDSHTEFLKRLMSPIGCIKTLLSPNSFILSKQRHRAIMLQPKYNSSYYLSLTKNK